MFNLYSNGKMIGECNLTPKTIEGFEKNIENISYMQPNFEATVTIDKFKYNPMQLGRLFGLEIIENESLIDTKIKQKRIHKKKRINKKWAKRYGYVQISTPKKEVYQVGNKIIGHPEIIKKMSEILV